MYILELAYFQKNTLRNIDIFQLTNIKISPKCWQNISNSKINSKFPMYRIYSANNYTVFVYHVTCKTVFVPFGAKISEPNLPHQHFPGAQFAWPDLPGAQFAAPTFPRGLICQGPISQDPICRGIICLKSNWQTTTPPTTPILAIKTKNPTKNIYHIHQLYIYMYQTQQVNQIYWVVWKIMKSWSRAMLDDSRAFYSHLT